MSVHVCSHGCYIYVYRVRAYVCNMPGSVQERCEKGCGHVGRSKKNLREQMRRDECSHRERNAKLAKREKEQEAQKGNSTS